MSVASPVFVDATGRRRRLLRRIAYAFGGVCMMYGGLICVSLAGGPVRSSAILPLPEFGGRHAKPAVAPPAPTPEPAATTPRTQRIVEALPRRAVPVTRASATRRPTPVTVRLSATAVPKPSPSPSVSTSRPTESTTTTTPTSAAPSASESAEPPSGGTGGGSAEPVPPAPPSLESSRGPDPKPDPEPDPDTDPVQASGAPEVPA